MSRAIFDADTLGGTTTLSSVDAVGNFTITVPAVDGTMSVKDASGDATFRNLTLTGAVLAGAWNGTTIAVAYGGTGATILTGYVKGNGTSAMTASATIPSTDITGLGTMSTQSSDAVTITGGTANGLSIGAINPAAGIFTTLRINSTLSLAGATGTSGQVLTSNGASAPTWQSVAGVGTVTSIDVSGGMTGLTTSGGPVTGSGTITLAGTLAAVNGGTGQSSYAVGNLLYASTTTALSKLAIGTTGQVLTVTAGIPAWATPTTGTVTSVAGTGTVNGLTLTGTVTSSGSLTLGGTLDLSSPPAIGGTAAAAGAFTTLTASTSLAVKDSVFTLQSAADVTKQALFSLTALTTGTTVTYSLPAPGLSVTLAALTASQTFSNSNTFSNGTNTFGSSVGASTIGLASGATTTGLTKTVNVGTAGLSGSTTVVNIGSSVSGATSTTLLNGTTTTTAYTETIVASGTVGASATLAITAGTILTATLTSATACTFTMPTATAGKSFTLLLKQPASGTATTATFTSVKWGSAGAPVITATLGKLDILAFVADGTNWYGTAAQGYTY
jgi:hypothetical protein